ncbi:MAG TPA: hypothetical protein VKC66_10965 [Xanthobacteraceae bacterium]|nr:hypothetical protein [Xanthobacteraceae bacterium]
MAPIAVTDMTYDRRAILGNNYDNSGCLSSVVGSHSQEDYAYQFNRLTAINYPSLHDDERSRLMYGLMFWLYSQLTAGAAGTVAIAGPVAVAAPETVPANGLWGLAGHISATESRKKPWFRWANRSKSLYQMPL